jgi:CheY-like chemotaxis protein
VAQAGVHCDMASILVADDTPGVRKLIQLIFQSEHRIIEAGDGKEALRLLLETRPPVAIVDVAMPELSGLDLCRRIRQDARLASTIVIVVTANGTPADRAAALAAGADHFMPKPFSPAAMQQVVDAALDGHPATLV